jgi:hypothetical protein
MLLLIFSLTLLYKDSDIQGLILYILGLARLFFNIKNNANDIFSVLVKVELSISYLYLQIQKF